GSNNSANGYYLAKLDAANNWVGSPEALIIKPLETFNLNFPMLDPSKLGGTRIIKVEANFTDQLKTFNFSPQKTVTSPKTAISSKLIEGDKLANNEVNTNHFIQMELYMVEDNKIFGDPVYLVGSNYYKISGASNSTSNNPIMLYDETIDGTVNQSAQSNFNDFNTEEYIGKPLGVGFNNLTEGQSYTFRLNLFEGSIFNKVELLSADKFYLLDKKSSEIKELDSNSVITFVADSNNNSRFEIYWNQSPKNLDTNDINKNLSTYIYKDNSQHKIRFEERNSSATIEVYDISGKLINVNKNIYTNEDFSLNLPLKSVYVIIIKYKNGKVASLKTINN
ncbi:T9SS type A sorting domain-containing protein, partial [Empedobacter brevis]|uniref:T9SS type A sorting domain-containing protein n=1 Tax=Empedobacter brevis TaxID=247 RepID=UPI002FE35599